MMNMFLRQKVVDIYHSSWGSYASQKTKSAKEALVSMINSYFKMNMLKEKFTTKASGDAFT